MTVVTVDDGKMTVKNDHTVIVKCLFSLAY